MRNKNRENATYPATAPSADRVPVTTWVFVAVLCTVQFVDVLGTTFLIVALPSVQHDMGLTNASTELLAGVYALFFGALLILGGKLSDVFGARSMLLAGLGLFIVASCIGGTALHPFLLFAGRSGQGISAALAAPAAMSLLAALFPAGGSLPFGIKQESSAWRLDRGRCRGGRRGLYGGRRRD